MANKEKLSPEALLARIKSLEVWLNEKSSEHLFDESLCFDLRSEMSGLEKNIKIARDKARKLCIGIIGQVKAGKSSFLNTVIFGGRQVLPKAATPMTAALTKLSYSETPQAIVHYYTQEEWSNLEKASHDFERNLEEAYEAYKKKLTEASSSRNRLFSRVQQPVRPLMSIEDYERKTFRSTQPEYLQAGRELIRMVKDPSILSKLGEAENLGEKSIDALMKKLGEYVGANGKFTPVVSYVELMLPDEQLRDLTIIDTPGLNDPIVSRTTITKQFLKECDVAFLLSPCSQFMDEKTIELMARRMPDAGISNIVVVGSKLDSGIANCKGRKISFKDALGSSVASYRKAFNENIAKAKAQSVYKGVIETFAKNEAADKPIFFSTMCYLIDKVLKSGGTLPVGSEEENAYNNLNSFEGFQDGYLYKISGVEEIKAAMKRVLDLKESIISGKDSSICSQALRSVLSLLGQIQNEALQLKKNLQELSEDSPEQLKERYEAMEGILNSSRLKIQSLFETAGYEAEINAQSIKRNCGMEMANYDAFKVDKRTTEDTHVVKHLFTKDTVYTTVETTYTADTAQIITNVRGFADKCLSHADEGFSSLFNEDNLKNRLIRIITEAYKQSGYKYDVDDILLPLETVFKKIAIPLISIDSHAAIDKLNSYYPQGKATNEEVHGLHTLQAECLNDIVQDMEKQINSSVEEVKRTMAKQAATFVDSIFAKLQATKEALLDMMKSKEQSIQRFDDFIKKLVQEKNSLVEEL